MHARAFGVAEPGGAGIGVVHVRHEVGDSTRKLAWALGLIFIALFATIVVTAPVFHAPGNIAVNDDDVLMITHTRCIMCHAKKPTRVGFAEAPKGIKLETLEEIRRYAQQIDLQAVKSSAMPLGNVSGMTPEERVKLGVWLAKQ